MCLLNGFECFHVISALRSVLDLPGEIAEVGVFDGASARLLCETKGDKPLHLFDTFAGLPESTAEDRGVYENKQPLFAANVESVREYLAGFCEVHLHQGLFPATATPVENRSFCFAHFDVDLYASTRACLEFFYPRMTPGGIMLSHDYSILAGVRQAVDEFYADKPEKPFELSTSQVMIVKR